MIIYAMFFDTPRRNHRSHVHICISMIEHCMRASGGLICTRQTHAWNEQTCINNHNLSKTSSMKCRCFPSTHWLWFRLPLVTWETVMLRSTLRLQGSLCTDDHNIADFLLATLGSEGTKDYVAYLLHWAIESNRDPKRGSNRQMASGSCANRPD